MRPHVTRPALCLALALVLWGGRVAGRSASSDSREGSPPACAARGDIPLDGLELSAEEEALLDDICWPPGATASELGAAAPPPRGVPPGINCTVTQWCDGDICTDICGRGTVSLEPWLENSVMQQTRLVQSLPLCFATLLGTHNSAISLADGYGNLDAHFSQFLNYIKWAVSDPSKLTLRTNDQLLSLTDQLNLGVRALELDTHWVGGDLRIAHCGGLHLDLLNKLVTALNFVAKLLHKRIRWDTETLGCSPSLSSIPTMEQRTLEDALREIAAWLDAPGREPDFLLLYFDDQADLQSWGVVGHLQETILRVFPPEVIFSVADKAAHPEAWPKVADLVVAGKRVMFVSNTDYGAAMQPYVFSRGQAVCGWTEPGLATVEGVPRCVVDTAGQVEPSPLFGGTLVRVETCELEYGPLNCDFVWHGTNQPVLDEETLPALVGCGLNIPAPDLMTPARAASAIWTWAPGHPYEPFERQGPPGRAAASGGTARGDRADAGAADAGCAVLSAADARWHAVSCTGARPSACRREQHPLGRPGAWVLADGPRGLCPNGTQFDLPRHPQENYQLAAALRAANATGAWLPVHGPDWSVDGWPARSVARQPSWLATAHLEVPIAVGLAGIMASVSVAMVLRGRGGGGELHPGGGAVPLLG